MDFSLLNQPRYIITMHWNNQNTDHVVFGFPYHIHVYSMIDINKWKAKPKNNFNRQGHFVLEKIEAPTVDFCWVFLGSSSISTGLFDEQNVFIGILCKPIKSFCSLKQVVDYSFSSPSL